MRKLLAQLRRAEIVASLFVFGVVIPAPAQVTTLTTFDRSQGQLPESIAIDKTGNIYVSFALAHTVERITPSGSASTFAVLPDGTPLLGVATDAEGNVYALLNASSPADKGVWRITPDGTQTLFANLPNAGLLNGLAFDHRGNLYVTDSFTASIYRIAEDGTASVWLYDPVDLSGVVTNACGTFPAGVRGANGIAYNHRSLYVLNTTQGLIVRIPVNPDGSPGAPVVFAGPTCELWGADGQAFDNERNLYVAVNIQNKIVRIDPSGTITTVLSGSPPFFTPTAIAFGTTCGTQKTMFITNSTFFSPLATPSIVTMSASAPGQPLP